MDRDRQFDDLEARTRQVFDAHHREQAADDRIMRRLVSLVSAEYFGLPPDWFAGRTVLDVGCGSNANASLAFLRLGAAHVHSVDLGTEWMEVARGVLAGFADRSTLGSENVLALGIDADTYDFVHCAGVLHHTADPRQGHRELVRVARPGGHVFVTLMATGNGLLYQFINLMRERYRREEGFRATIDGLSVDRVAAGFDWLLGVQDRHEPIPPDEARFLRGLVDADLVLTIKDRIQAPTYHDFGVTEEQIRGWFTACGCVEVTRLSRYTYGFANLRRFLAPMYLHHDHPVARFWFGDGYVQMIGRKGGGEPPDSAGLPDPGRELLP
jgi:2-polyprenyl-3-methyl-5-hydroxy-6-metoxy-1,4-benzoquinol methylase